MSRQNKQRKKNIQIKKAKGANAGKHFSDGAKRSRYPSEQPKPVWVRSTGKKGWWNAPRSKTDREREARASK